MASARATTVGRLRVVQVIPILKVGGLERVATTLSILLAQEVERVVVCSKGGDPFEPLLLAAGVPVEHVPRPKPELRQQLRSAWAIARVLRRERPDVIHAHNPAAATAAAAARRLARLPETALVTTYHGVMPDRVGRAARVMASVSDLVVGVGPSSTAALRRAGLDAERSRTIHNAVDPSPSRSAAEVRAEFGAEDAELVVTVGRYATEKNQALLIDAVGRLAVSRPRIRLLLVGDGLLEDELRAQVGRLGLGAVVTITGERSDAVDLTAAADVFALSSDSEGLPLALLEANAVRTAVVTTDAGGVRDAVTDGETGLVVPVGDVDALAAALERVLSDDALRRRLAENAAAFVARTCSPAAMTSLYVEAYLDAVARRRASA